MASRREKTLAKLAAIPAKVRARLAPAIRKEAAAVVAMQKRLVAVESGGLRDSIRFVAGDVLLDSTANLSGGGRRGGSGGGGYLVKGDPDLSATIIAGDREHFYARFVEFGTSPHPQKGAFKGTTHPGTSAQPFFYGPFRAAKKGIKRRISRETGRAVKEAVS
jgi:HK97 gp10 family phage protein